MSGPEFLELTLRVESGVDGKLAEDIERYGTYLAMISAAEGPAGYWMRRLN